MNRITPDELVELRRCYAAADGTLVLRFRFSDEGIEVAADITK